MKQDSLTKFIDTIRRTWGPIDSQLVSKTRSLLEELARTRASESWLKELQGNLQIGHELYRDPEHGFILLAHSEKKGLYRPPHDHGNAWVIYAVQSGEMEMGTYSRIEGATGRTDLIRREVYRMKEGESRVYLPGDIHDTRCVSDSVLMLRLTSSDLDVEKQQGRMHKYPYQP